MFEEWELIEYKFRILHPSINTISNDRALDLSNSPSQLVTKQRARIAQRVQRIRIPALEQIFQK